MYRAVDRQTTGMMRTHTILVLSATVLAFHAPLSGQSPSAPLTIISPDGRRTLDTLEASGRQLVPLDALAALFRLDVREDGGGTLTIGSGDQSVIVTANQQLVSVAGRLVSLSSPPRRVDGRWLVPVDGNNTHSKGSGYPSIVTPDAP